MAEKETQKLSIGNEIVDERKFPSMMENDSQSWTFSGFYSLPVDLRHIVASYISNDKKDPTKYVLLGEQRITLCLSQHAKLKLGSYWRVGCLTPEERWESSNDVRVDKTYLFKDYQSFLDDFSPENWPFFDIVIEVLVIQLDVSAHDFSSALDVLQDTLVKLQIYLISVQTAVVVIEKYNSFYFSFNNGIENEFRPSQTIISPFALRRILIDLRTCWKINHKLNTKLLLEYYISNDVKPDSGIYLSKFVIALNHLYGEDFFNDVAPALNSSKLKRIYYLETFEDLNQIDQRITTRDCHAILLDASMYEDKCLPDSLGNAFFLEDNRSIERIVINSRRHGYVMELPRPTKPLTNTTPRSALVELSLTSDRNTFNLLQLNNGYFPHLAHLSIVGGKMKGRLDSQSVPSLKTLIIELGRESKRSVSNVGTFLRKHTQAIIDTGRPWQVVASRDQKGWSLASYDDPTTNPRNEVKEDSRPYTRELILVLETQKHAYEWESRLNGKPSLEATADNQKSGLLVWAPERVEKISAFCTLGLNLRLKFKEIPKQTRLLSSLACHKLNAVINGDVLPHLQSLGLNFGEVWLSGAFPQLKRLSLQDTMFRTRWQMDAPLLQSFSCCSLSHGEKLSLSPDLLPCLSYLRIKLFADDALNCPTILLDGDSIGLSRINHVVLGKGITESLFFNQWQVHKVSHLELTVDALDLPTFWENTEWRCEMLAISIYAYYPERLRKRGITAIKMPPLPLVKKLTVAEDNCRVLLNSDMLNLTGCTVPSPQSLGEKLRCPALTRIRFTDKLSESDKKKCLDQAMFAKIGARPRWVYFDASREWYGNFWDIAASKTGF